VIPLNAKALLVDRTPPEILLHDEVDACPYIPGRDARMPLRLPTRMLRAEEFDGRLARGDRRHGHILYTPTCPTCRACEPIRVDVNRFRPSKTQRRVKRKGDDLLTWEIGDVELSLARVRLYEKHLRGRNLGDGTHPPMTLARYRGFIVDRCCESFELRLSLDGELVAVAITDRGKATLSAHYTFHDPDHARLSLGTYAILKQIELAQQWGLNHVYLGLFIAENRSMRYKARFRPHDRRIGGTWTVVDDGSKDPLP